MLTLYATVYVCMREWISHESRSLWPPRQANGGQLLLVTKPWSHVLKWKVKLFFSRLVLMTTQRAIRFSSIQQKQSLVCNFNWISRIWNFMPIFFLLSSLNRFKEKKLATKRTKICETWPVCLYSPHTGPKNQKLFTKNSRISDYFTPKPNFLRFQIKQEFRGKFEPFLLFLIKFGPVWSS